MALELKYQIILQNSGSDGSGSCSGSSSESESSSSSQSSTADNSFNLTSMQTGGLKLKIAAVRKSPDHIDSSKSNDASNPPRTKTDFTSDSDSETELRPPKGEVGRKTPNKIIKPPEPRSVKKTPIKNDRNVNKKLKPVAKRRRAAVKCSSSEDGENRPDAEESESDNTILAATCSLQEIRQEDLAAILPDQECDAFGGFECEPRDKGELINETGLYLFRPQTQSTFSQASSDGGLLKIIAVLNKTRENVGWTCGLLFFIEETL